MSCVSVREVGGGVGGCKGKLLNTVKLLSMTTAYFAVVCLLSAALDPAQLNVLGWIPRQSFPISVFTVRL